MSIMELGAIGEFVGAMAVVATLVFLAVQVRHGARTIEETNRLERAAAIDRHNDSIGRWRGRLMESADLARIWLATAGDEELNDTEKVRFDNLYIDLLNTQRSNFTRAKTVGEEGLARQAVLSVANEIYLSRFRLGAWEATRAWIELVEPDFVRLVDERIVQLQHEGPGRYVFPTIDQPAQSTRA